MAEFLSKKPSGDDEVSGILFRGGMMPAAPTRTTHLIIFDLRALGLHADEGRKIEQALRDTLEKELASRDIKGRSVIDLSTAVHGISIE